jgi:hypothetical protein
MDDMSKDNYLIEGEEEVSFYYGLVETWTEAIETSNMDLIKDLAKQIANHPKAYNMLILMLTHAGGEAKARDIKIQAYQDILKHHKLLEEATELTFDKAEEVIGQAYAEENNSDLR